MESLAGAFPPWPIFVGIFIGAILGKILSTVILKRTNIARETPVARALTLAFMVIGSVLAIALLS